MLYPYGFVPYSLKFSSVYLPYLLVNVCLNHGWHRYHGYTVLFRNPKLVHSISIHLIRVICGGGIGDEKRHIPADFSILPVNGYARSKVHSILRDRAYIGDVRYQGQWYAGKHKPLVDRATFGRVQVLLGGKRYQNHDLTYAGSLITCGHCGAVITGETITKKKTGREYVYYRCSRYTEEGHPRIRLTEQQLDVQVLALFDRIRLPDDLRHWFQQSLLAWSKQQRNETEETAKDLQRQIAQVKQARDRLLNLRIMEEITTDTYAAKDTELRDRLANLELQVQAQGRGRDEHGDLAIKVFELSQSLKDKWFTAESQEKRQLLEIVCLNLTLIEAYLDFSMRKPFDVLTGGLIPPDNRGDRI